jgi:hypothetical protein
MNFQSKGGLEIGSEERPLSNFGGNETISSYEKNSNLSRSNFETGQ